jgi:hypothetical protein
MVDEAEEGADADTKNEHRRLWVREASAAFTVNVPRFIHLISVNKL